MVMTELSLRLVLVAAATFLSWWGAVPQGCLDWRDVRNVPFVVSADCSPPS